MLLHLENMTHCEDVQCFRPWVFQVGLCTILVFLIEAQVLYAGVFVSLPLTAHCSRLMNSTEGTNRGLTMMRELSSMVWIRLVPWCLRYTKDKETPSGPTANSQCPVQQTGAVSPHRLPCYMFTATAWQIRKLWGSEHPRSEMILSATSHLLVSLSTHDWFRPANVYRSVNTCWGSVNQVYLISGSEVPLTVWNHRGSENALSVFK